VKNQEQINQLHDVLSTVRLDKQNALVRRLVRKTQDGTLGQPGDSGDDSSAEEDESVDNDKVNFGDVTNTYNLAGAAKDAVEKAAPSLWPYILAAALGGSGLGAAAMALPMAWKAVNVVKSSDTDTDTSLDIQFKDEK
jgi:hypothetical protein